MTDQVLLYILTSITSLMTISFMYFNTAKKRWCWLISIASQPIWWVILVMTHTYPLFALNAVTLVLAIRGWYKWKNQ